jgi:RNA polymerase sigma-70 factor (ECF subfamily)
MPAAGDSVEIELVRRAKQRDAEAVAELYRLHAPRIYRYCLLHVADASAAEDITEEVFVNMVEALPRYVYRGVPFSAWLYRLAHDRVIDFYRRDGRRPTEDLTDELVDGAPAPEEAVAHLGEIGRLRQAMAQLSDDHQMVLQLRFVEGFDLEQTARHMHKSIGAIKLLQHRAVRRLGELLKNDA